VPDLIDLRAFVHDRAAVREARRYVTDAFADQPAELLQNLELMASELASNCVRHTRSDFTVEIKMKDGVIRVAVTDWGPGEPVMRKPAPTAISGRGLAIVDMLSSCWDVERLAGGVGKTVWFTVHTDASSKVEPRQPSGS
jgi:anti-sigma regulatory factor (Ser/Thr protein kinase)